MFQMYFNVNKIQNTNLGCKLVCKPDRRKYSSHFELLFAYKKSFLVYEMTKLLNVDRSYVDLFHNHYIKQRINLLHVLYTHFCDVVPNALEQIHSVTCHRFCINTIFLLGQAGTKRQSDCGLRISLNMFSVVKDKP